MKSKLLKKHKKAEKLRLKIEEKIIKHKESKGRLIIVYSNGNITKVEYDFAVSQLDKEMLEEQIKVKV